MSRSSHAKTHIRKAFECAFRTFSKLINYIVNELENEVVNMSEQKGNLSSLPLNAMRDIPTPNADAQEIVALVKDGGRVTGYQLSDGRILDKEEGVSLARQGGIRGVGISARKGNEYLKSLPDDTEGNNLGNLPSVKQ